jgi:DNA replication protein DnaC
MKDELLKEILREYDAYRLEEQQAQKEREAEVLRSIPELARLRRSLVSSMAKKARTLVRQSDPISHSTAKGSVSEPADSDRNAKPDQGTESSPDMESEWSRQTKEKEAALLAEHGYPRDYLDIHFRCPRCRDTGYVGDLVKKKCSCLIQKLAERSYRFAELSETEQENFGTFDAGVFPKAPMEGSKLNQREYMEHLKNVLWDYQTAYPDNPKKNILFTGKTGLGKTFLLNCLAKSILEKGYTVLKLTSFNLFENLFRSSLQNSEEGALLLKDRIFSVDVLIIDDLGTETRRNNFTAEELFNILNERYLQKQHTFLSTNLSLSDLRDFYSDRVTSRLFDTQNTMIFRFAGQDIRLRTRHCGDNSSFKEKA